MPIRVAYGSRGPLKTIYFIRHGESETNVRSPPQIGGRHSWAELTSRGVAQSRALGERFRQEERVFDQIVASTAVRAQQTARHCLERLEQSPDDVTTYPELEELDQGEWSGRRFEEVLTPAQLAVMEQKNWRFRPPGGESQEDVFARVSAWIERRVLGTDHAHTLVFSHGLLIKVMLTGLLGLDKRKAWWIKIDNSSLSIVTYDRGAWSERARNDTAHTVGVHR